MARDVMDGGAAAVRQRQVDEPDAGGVARGGHAANAQATATHNNTATPPAMTRRDATPEDSARGSVGSSVIRL
ncbi:hypothetical protein GCM10011320_03650 [Neoroseomonas lacus]|uniref:Uncharacterized protein n=1 Tax=Neoroseomonas lacus TaxID=287609 RepID=A0A917NGT7_9PROT|nr:hypothetical protein GCM10011320_03650 [Neoroseomonas lacus]